MHVVILNDYREVSEYVGKIFADAIESNPKICLGLATGSTPEGVYNYLIDRHKNGLDFSKVRTVNLDEYIGLDAQNEQSYAYFMSTHLFNHINTDRNNTHLPNGMATDLCSECCRYDDVIAREKIDIQLLGIGENGHIAFNEPSDSLEAKTHVVDLTPETIAVNSRFFNSENDVPRKALTMGVGSILTAGRIVLMACGAKKRDAMKKLLADCSVSTQLPASFLHLHPDVTIVTDKEAMGL